LPPTYYHEHHCQVLGRVMLGYERDDLDNMVLAIDSALTTVNPDDDPWLHRNLTQASDFLSGLWAEGYFD